MAVSWNNEFIYIFDSYKNGYAFKNYKMWLSIIWTIPAPAWEHYLILDIKAPVANVLFI